MKKSAAICATCALAIKLRPAASCPGPATQAAAVTAATTDTGPHAWPTELAQQMQVLRDALQQAGR